MAQTTVHNPTTTRPEAVPAPRGQIGARLLRFALANLRRQPERSLLAIAGVALAITAVVVVRTVSAGYQGTGVAAVADAVGSAPFWVVPADGVRFDRETGTVTTAGALPEVDRPAGWTATTVLTGRWPGTAGVALEGRDTPTHTAAASALALFRLGVRAGSALTIAGTTLTVVPVERAGAVVTVPVEVARAAGLTTGWLTLAPPSGHSGTADEVARATGLRVTPDPAQRPVAGGRGLVYATDDSTSRASFLSFQQKFAGVFGGQVAGSVLGLVAQVGLVLGFVIAVTSFVAATRERRREFGIMASIGLTDEVLYFFLVESAVMFVVAYLAGVAVGGAIVAVVLPAFFTVGAWLEAAGLVAMYLPALAIVAALIPVHRLLQQRPVHLLVDQ